jgi:hypothetical protein
MHEDRVLAKLEEHSRMTQQGQQRSPLIKHISWGRMTVDNVGAGKDFKLWPGGGRAWDWTETGTHHVPGVQPADVEELLHHGANIIVLSRGVLMRLGTCKETLELLKTKGVEVRTAETMKAARLYNRLASSGQAVGGLFHSTC